MKNKITAISICAAMLLSAVVCFCGCGGSDVPDGTATGSLSELPSPSNEDGDLDGLTGADEEKFGSDPANPDTDGDGLPDGVEASLGTDLLLSDSDGDGVSDKEDAFPLSAMETSDTDKDGIGDNTDNCVNASNADQLDTDGDKLGDACADDDDGDGVSDTNEAALGTDPKRSDSDLDGVPDGVEVQLGTNPLAEDSDGDLVFDGDDAFPLNAGETADADKDGVGDNGDNCVNVANKDQRNTDFEYNQAGQKTPMNADVEGDNLGDACDDDFDGDGRNVVYVRPSGMDDNPGTFVAPVKTIKRAIELAKQRKGADVYAAAGTYDISNATFEDGIDLKGGFANGFADYKQHTKNDAYKSALVNSGSPATFALEDFSGSFSLDGFYIGSDSPDDAVGTKGLIPDTDDHSCTQASVYLVNSRVNLSNNVITVSNKAGKPCAVLLGTGAEAMLDANRIDATGSQTKAISSTGVCIVEAPATLTNNIIIAGSGEHSFGVRTVSASPVLINNTIDGTSAADSPKVAYGATFDGGAPEFVNNIIFTGGAPDQATLVCSGSGAGGMKFENNLLTTFPQDGATAVLIDCEGEFRLIEDYNIDPTFTLKGASVVGNAAYAGIRSGLVNALYELAGSAGVDKGQAVSLASDYNGGARPKGGKFDTGAIEKQ